MADKRAVETVADAAVSITYLVILYKIFRRFV